MRFIPALLLTLALMSVPVNGDALELIVNQVAPANHFYHTDILKPWAREVDRVTEGRVRLIFSIAPMGSYRRNFDMVRAGITDVAGGNQSATPGRFVVTQINESPFLGTSSVEAISVALWRTYQRYLKAADEFSGTQVLALHASGTQHWYTSKKPIRRLSDIVGLKIAAPSDVGARLLASLGAIPVFLTAPELHDGLSRGIIDGVSMSYTGVTRLGLSPYLRYQTRLAGGAGLSFGGFFLVANRDSWARISADDQHAIMQVSGEAFARRAARVFRRVAVESVLELKNAGIEDIQAVRGFDQELRKASLFLDPEWTARARELGVEADAALAYFRAEVEREAGAMSDTADEWAEEND